MVHKRSSLALLFVLLFACAVSVKAQTYTLPHGATFLCDAESYKDQVVCRGIPMVDSKDDLVGGFAIFSFLREGAYLPGVPYDAYGIITNWDVFNPPPTADGKTTGTFKFEWDQNGQTGTASATYTRVLKCGNRCWVHPELLTFTVVVNP